MSKVRIANPRPGGAQYTTIAQADRFVRRHEAYIDGEQLHFLQPAELRQTQGVMAAIAAERHRSDVYITRQVWWNGDDPDPYATHGPGDIRS
ncbi:MAG TPA: hypothetical protein VMO00_18610 [Methylomirabilota bacterium]|nr:hypothetical protein [Methylomirabilota bacterium]